MRKTHIYYLIVFYSPSLWQWNLIWLRGNTTCFLHWVEQVKYFCFCRPTQLPIPNLDFRGNCKYFLSYHISSFKKTQTIYKNNFDMIFINIQQKAQLKVKSKIKNWLANHISKYYKFIPKSWFSLKLRSPKAKKMRIIPLKATAACARRLLTIQ